MAGAMSCRLVLQVVMAGAILALVCSVAISAELPNSAFRAGRWDGSAYADKDGTFSHCAALSSQPKSTLLLFSQSADGAFYIGVTRPAWNLPIGEKYTVLLSLDGTSWGAQEALTVDASLIRVGPI